MFGRIFGRINEGMMFGVRFIFYRYDSYFIKRIPIRKMIQNHVFRLFCNSVEFVLCGISFCSTPWWLFTGHILAVFSRGKIRKKMVEPGKNWYRNYFCTTGFRKESSTTYQKSKSPSRCEIPFFSRFLRLFLDISRIRE